MNNNNPNAERSADVRPGIVASVIGVGSAAPDLNAGGPDMQVDSVMKRTVAEVQALLQQIKPGTQIELPALFREELKTLGLISVKSLAEYELTRDDREWLLVSERKLTQYRNRSGGLLREREEISDRLNGFVSSIALRLH